MLQLGTYSEPAWRVCKLEIERGGVSYTVDTLRQLDEELPDAVLFFLMGADALRDAPHWHEPREIFSLATPLVVRRAGQPEPDMELLRSLCAENKHPKLIEMPAVDVSSSDIRRRVAANLPIEDLVPAAVATYISSHGLYR
jgi:nicotinate-nucleotide adenylyltransferase